MKRELFQDKEGKPSMMRYLSFFSFWIGSGLAVLSFIMLCVSYFMRRPGWASYFMTLIISGLADAGAGIAGKAIQKRHEGNKTNYS